MDKNYGFFVKIILVATAKLALLPSPLKLLFLLTLFSIHILLTWLCRDFTWLAAFGGLLTVLGVLLIFHYSLPENESREYKPKETVRKEDGEYVLEPERGFASYIPEEVAKQLIQEQKQQAIDHANYINEKRKHLASYLIFTIAGTLLWAYAGFLNYIFKCNT
jgi:hypothetical protein